MSIHAKFLTDDMAELSSQTPLRAPNVAAVPQYSPFRYPGGKSRLYPFAKRWLSYRRPETLVEPFAGGAHIGIAAAIEGLVERVVLVELDKYVAAVWETIMNGGATHLMEQIRAFEMTSENLDALFERKDESTHDTAFAMLVHNRISRGGITALGAGRLNQGENGRGILSRWYPETLVKRIEQIAAVKECIEVIENDAFEIIRHYADMERAAFFIDPPYQQAGRRLYRHFEVEHATVFQVAQAVRGDALITYDDSDETNGLVEAYGFNSRLILMPTTHHRYKRELLIGKDLSWLDE